MYKLPELPYLYQDLEPYIDTHTMGLHYHKHQQNYLNNLNILLKQNNYDYRYSLEELPYHINEFSESSRKNILFNLGGVLNHHLYWKSMHPTHRKKPLGNLAIALSIKYQTLHNFWSLIKESALSLHGSGYIFLLTTPEGELSIGCYQNQNLPQSDGLIPLFVIDMWEHAYYINYENDKRKYLENLQIIADFTYANQVYNNILK